MQTLWALLKISRLHNTIPLAFVPFMGAIAFKNVIQVGQYISWQCFFFLTVSFLALMVATAMINDFFDVDIDKINRPNRPLASEKITPQTVIIAATLLTTAAVLTLWIVFGTVEGLIAVATSILNFLYSKHLKLTGTFGEAIISASNGLGLFLGDYAVNNTIRFSTIFLYVVMLGFFLAFTWLATIPDVKGDSLKCSKTFAVTKGVAAAGKYAFILAIFTVLVTYLSVPYVRHPLNYGLALSAIHIYTVVSFALAMLNAKREDFRLFYFLTGLATYLEVAGLVIISALL
ncbi:UbiA family prenyltransferase [Carboxydocella sp. ULO1]|uniref:UbiA family prenyltransferase n=1 Tax=Carboxydocella sp. ULO1 TaxID=1926599 RepID=UPI0009AC35FC|nr:UbiA family prenyltransferase [Carboxydocella sp. ULO1]GAW28621.1 prenyltransferase [Carboxydocella sp. ULO1]